MLRERNQTQSCVVLFHLYEISRIGKSIERERLMVTRAMGVRVMRRTTSWVWGFIFEWWKGFRTKWKLWLHNITSVLNASELLTLKWLILSRELHLHK